MIKRYYSFSRSRKMYSMILLKGFIASPDCYLKSHLRLEISVYVNLETDFSITSYCSNITMETITMCHFAVFLNKFEIIDSCIFRVLHNGGCANSSTGSVNQLTSSLFIPLLKYRTYST